MRKPPAHRVRGAAHITLLHLKTVGITPAADLANLAKDKVSSLRHDIFRLSLLPRMLREGLVAATDGGVIATEAGLQLLEDLEAMKPVVIPKDETVVQANLYTANRDKTPYSAPELKHVAWRPGAFDYLNCPSVIAGKPTPYFIKLKE